MIINNNVQSLLSAYATNSSRKPKFSMTETNMEARDEVQLSSQAKSFSEIFNKLKSQSEADQIRSEKVAYYEGLVQSGEYKVDSRELASSMIQCRF